MDISSLTPDKQVKLQYWLEVIRQCRASGLTNQAWCEQHNISLKSYYYWIAKIRKLALEDLPRKNNGIHTTADQNTLLSNPASEFAEIPLPDRLATRSDPAPVLHIGTITVEIFEDTSCESAGYNPESCAIMLGDISHVEKIYIRCGYTDMRKQINGLVDIIQYNFKLDPYSNSLFLFCGKLQWPRTGEEAKQISELLDQFHLKQNNGIYTGASIVCTVKILYKVINMGKIDCAVNFS